MAEQKNHRFLAVGHHQQGVAEQLPRRAHYADHQLRVGLQAARRGEVQLVQSQGLQGMHGEQGEEQQTLERIKFY